MEGQYVLTERTIRDAKPQDRQYMIWDPKLKGFGVKVSKAVKSYVVDYRVDGYQRRATIGRVGEVSLREARRRAADLMDSIRHQGRDPLAERQERREAPTVAEGLDQFFNEFVPHRVEMGRMAPRTVSLYRRMSKAIYKRLGKRRIEDVRRKDVQAMVRNMAPMSANRTLDFTRRVFNEFEKWEWRARHTNPVFGIERAKEVPRDRTLAPSEMAVLAEALNYAASTRPAATAAIRLCAVTGLRVSEVLSLQWEDVDFERGLFTLRHTKTGRRQHHLSQPAREIIESQPKVNAWIFTTGRDAAITYRYTCETFRQVADVAGLEDVRLHDLRRTFMTAAAAAGLGTHALRDLLGHQTTAMADRYVRTVGAPVAEAREQIGQLVADAMAGTQSLD